MYVEEHHLCHYYDRNPGSDGLFAIITGSSILLQQCLFEYNARTIRLAYVGDSRCHILRKLFRIDGRNTRYRAEIPQEIFLCRYLHSIKLSGVVQHRQVLDSFNRILHST